MFGERMNNQNVLLKWFKENMSKCLKNASTITIKFSLLQTGHKRFIRLTKQKQKYNKVHENAQNVKKKIFYSCVYCMLLWFWVQ